MRLWPRRRRSVGVRQSVYDAGNSHHGLMGPDGTKYDEVPAWIQSLEPPSQSVRAKLIELKKASRVEAARGGWLRSAVLAFRREVVGSGIRLKSLHPSERARAALEDAWGRWTEAPDVTGRLTWRGFLHSAVHSLVVDGEVLVRQHFGEGDDGYLVELLDSARLDVNRNSVQERIVMGVETDAAGRPSVYWLVETDAASYGWTSAPHPASSVLHVYDTELPGQYRGVPWAFATLRRFGELREYDEAERKGARLNASLFAGYKPDTPPPLEENEEPKKLELKPGQIAEHDGELTVFKSERPSTAYADYVNANLTSAAASLGISHATLSGDLSRANFISSRQGMIHEQGTFSMVAQLLEEQLLRPIYKQWLMAAYARKRIKSNAGLAALEKVRWVRDAPRHVQPREVAEANRLALESGTKSKAEVIREDGRDPAEVFAEIEEEKDAGREEQEGAADAGQADAADAGQADAADGEQDAAERG